LCRPARRLPTPACRGLEARADRAERVGEPAGAGELTFAPGVLGGEPGVEEGGEVFLNRISLSDSETYSARMVASSTGSSRRPPHFRASSPATRRSVLKKCRTITASSPLGQRRRFVRTTERFGSRLMFRGNSRADSWDSSTRISSLRWNLIPAGRHHREPVAANRTLHRVPPRLGPRYR